MNWKLPKKIAFNFIAIYLFFYTMSNQFIFSGFFDMGWARLAPWFGKNILGLSTELDMTPSGSGDGLYSWVCVLLYATVAFFIAILLPLIERNRWNYNKLFEWLVVLVRYYIIFQMALYGLAKFFNMQFSEPSFSRLLQPYGDSSPMGLLWTFMGFSEDYTFFSGVGEMAGAILLLFRRTRTLGAAVVFGVMANVAALNFFYDVPVKILSSHLVLMAVFLLLIDGKRLLNLFILNKPTEAIVLPPHFKNAKIEKAKDITKWVLVVGGLGFGTYQLFQMKEMYSMNAAKPPLYGLYEVDSFIKNNDTIPPLTTDYNRWKRIIVERAGFAKIERMDDYKATYSFKPDTINQLVEISLRNDTVTIDTLFYSYLDSAIFKLAGVFQQDSLEIWMHSKQKSDFLLMGRGFNWVSEQPFNR